MKKSIIAAIALAACATPALAGGFLTNSNQTASFGRFFALEGYRSVEGAYYNPAGIGFLPQGWHLAFNNQSAFQTRTAISTFAPYAAGDGNNGAISKKFKGTATAPILPALDVAYVSNNGWFGSAHIGIVGGGGKCEFDNGIGTFESVVAMMPTALNGLSNVMMGSNLVDPSYYAMDSYMRGKQFFVGAQIMAGYKFKPGISVSLGGRLVYATSNYYGYVDNIRFRTATPLPTASGVVPAGTPVGAQDLINAAAGALGKPALAAMGDMISHVEVNCDQKGWGFAPIVAVGYNRGPLSIGARYEFKTRLRMKNQSSTTAEQAALLHNVAEYQDGIKVPNDIPALLAVGATYDFLPNLRAGLSAHYYFDKQAHQWNNKQKLLKHNTWEILAGVEWDVTDQWTVSAGGQTTNYGLGKDKAYISDVSFITSSYSLGLGAKYKINKRIAINASYFKTFYYSTRKTQADYNGIGNTLQNIVGMAATNGLITPEQATAIATNMSTPEAQALVKGNDLFDRTNDVVSIGVEFSF
ncbi:MAG: outer membrane beta-barrel protein [Alloprevotella sp.]|nr:outer membrane beta-barrel protein [Alloprevotella sp.]